MELEHIYKQLDEKLEHIDFASLFSGFHRFPFALYDDKKAYINGEYIDKPGDFLGNTSVKYNGEPIAIWNIREEVSDFDVMASKIVHEMLHAYQDEAGESRWADERAAFIRYKYDPANTSARLKEAALMKKCLTENAPDDFRNLLELRKARCEKFSYEYDYEARIEQIEGTANFVELAALAQLNEKKAKESWDRLFDTLEKLSEYFPVRAITYYSGAAFMACLKKYTSLDTDAFGDEPFSIAAIKDVEPCELPETDDLTERCYSEWKKQTKDTITQTIKAGKLILEGEFRLISFNVYNAVRCGDYGIITYFLGYIEGTELPKTDEELFSKMKVLNGDYVVQVDDDLCMKKVWEK